MLHFLTNFAKSLELVSFIIGTFRLSEDEVTRLHAPVTAFAIFDLVRSAIQSGTCNADLALAISIAHALLKETSNAFFASNESASDTPEPSSSLTIAASFYSATDNKSAGVPASGFARQLIKNGLEDLVQLTTLCSKDDHHLAVLQGCLDTLGYLADLLPGDMPREIDWTPAMWLSSILDEYKQPGKRKALDYAYFETILHCLLCLRGAPICPPLLIDERATIFNLLQSVRSARGCLVLADRVRSSSPSFSRSTSPITSKLLRKYGPFKTSRPCSMLT